MILARTSEGRGTGVGVDTEAQATKSAMGRYRVLYIINSLSRGGAELGLKMLIEQRLFADVHLEIMLIHKGDEQLYESLRQHPDVAHIHVVDGNRKLRPLGMAKALLFVLRTCRRGKCDMIIASLAQSNMIALSAARLFPSVKVASFFHNTSYSKALYEVIVKALSRRIDCCLYDNIKTYEAVEKKLPAKEARRWFYLPLFVSQEAISKTRYTTSASMKIFSVGRLNEQKNYFEALHAIRLLLDEGCDVTYSIAGEGDLDDALREKIKQLDLEQHVDMLGFRDDWQTLVEAMDVYLLASSREGLSIATLEAMSYGLPVVATNVGGVQEYGQHMRNMVVVDEPKAKAIADGLKQLVNSADLRARLGGSAKVTSVELFGQQAVALQYEEVKKVLFSY